MDAFNSLNVLQLAHTQSSTANPDYGAFQGNFMLADKAAEGVQKPQHNSLFDLQFG